MIGLFVLITNKFNPIKMSKKGYEKTVTFNDVCVNEGTSRNSLGEERTPLRDIESQNETQENTCRKRCSIVAVLIATLITFVLLLMISSRNYPENNLTASLSFHHHHHRTMDEQCNDTNYGCCEVYQSCHIDGDGNFSFSPIKIWPSVQIKRNRIGSNCPRMNQIVKEYNSNYYSEDYNCSSYEFGCCEIDISCDQYIHFGIETKSEKEQKHINYSLYDTGDKTMRTINLKKINPAGTNCPSFEYVVTRYNQGFYNDLTFIVVLFILGGFVSGCYGCIDYC